MIEAILIGITASPDHCESGVVYTSRTVSSSTIRELLQFRIDANMYVCTQRLGLVTLADRSARAPRYMLPFIRDGMGVLYFLHPISR